MHRAAATFGALFLLVGTGALALASDPGGDSGVPDRVSKDAGPADPPPGGFAPDPPPLKTKHQYELQLLYREGEIQLAGVRRVELPKPVETARRMGRFAIELHVGKELVDRVRFDFPLLGADEFAGRKRPHDAPPSFERKLTTRTTVRIPHSERATKARLVDRATGRIVELPWPLEEADAGQSAP